MLVSVFCSGGVGCGERFVGADLGAVIVRRVVEARRLKAEGGSREQRGQHAHSAARTQPLAPIDEKGSGLGSVDLVDRPGGKTKRGGFWARLRCW